MLGFLHYLDARFGWWDDRETALPKARAYADRALELDRENADATLPQAPILVQERYDEAVIDAKKQSTGARLGGRGRTCQLRSRRRDIPKRQ